MSAGARSSATRMPASRSDGRGASTPSRRASTSRPTLRRSAARARRYGSSSAVQPTAVASTASCHAAAAAAPSTDPAAGRLEERVVVEEQQVRLEDRGARPPGPSRDVVALPRDLRPRARERLVERGQLLVVPTAREPVGDGDLRCREPACRPDRDARRRGQTVQHALGLRSLRPRPPMPPAGPARLRRLRREVLGRFVEPALGELTDGLDRRVRLRAPRNDFQGMPRRRAEGRDGVQAAGAHRSASGGHVGDAHVRVERAGRLDQPRRRPCVEPVGQIDHDGDPRLGAVGRRRLERPRRPRAGDRGSGLPEVGGLAGQTAPRLRRHLLEAPIEPRGDGRRDGAFHERGVRQQNRRAAILVEELDRHLGGQDRAAQIHQDQHAVGGPHRLDRGEHPHRVRPDRVVGTVEPAGRRHAHVLAAHLSCELGRALRERTAVRHQDDADHRLRPGSRARRSGGIRTRA